jgi:hypothetical protein
VQVRTKQGLLGAETDVATGAVVEIEPKPKAK